jgi:hypothetical protein
VCQPSSISFVMETPSVFVLADRSGSEFTTATTGLYFTLRTAVLQAISDLQAASSMRMGFGSYLGDHTSATCAPVLDSTAIDINNGLVIAAKYNSVGPLLPFGAKAEGPASAVLPLVKAALQADPGTGGKYMLFVSDGESDFCDDSNSLCPVDAVTYRLQDMFAANIGTVMFGQPSAVSSLTVPALQNFANAGAGLTVALPPASGVTMPSDVYFQCMGFTGWKSLWNTASRTGNVPIASYGTPGGTATVYGSNASATLLDQAKAAIASMRSCSFKLSGAAHIDLANLGGAHVKILGTEVVQDAATGWSMTSDTELALHGPACVAWRTPSATIDFQFPCEAIVF